MSNAPVQRLDKVIATSGVLSRRGSADAIREGRVEVGSEIVREPGRHVGAGADIRVDGRRLKAEQKIYIILNKPAGVTTTVSDPHARQTVFDVVGRIKQRLYPVGRLDKDTTGLLLLTNDGEIANRLLHPKYQVPRTYIAEVRGEVKPKIVKALASGIVLGGRRTGGVRAEILHTGPDRSAVQLTMFEGRKRQIREMMLRLGHPVKKLKRVEFGPLKLGNLGVGQWRNLTQKEIQSLKESILAR